MEPCGAFVFSAPEQLFELFRCYAWLIWFRQRTALLEPKRSCSRLALLTLRCRTEMFFQNIPVLRSAYFPKKLFSFFSKTLDLQVRFALPPMGGGSFAPPCTPLSCPPKNANGRAGGKRTRPGGKRNRARRRRRLYAAAQRTPARRSRARGLPVRGSQGQDGRPRGGPGEPQRPRFALPRLLRHSAYSPIFPAKILFAEGMRRCCAKFSFLWISF